MRVTSSSRRRGFVAALVLVILMVITLLTGVLLKLVLARQTELHSAERRLQAEWLAEAALDRAVAKLAADPKYNGETWEIPAVEFAGFDNAAVLIALEAVPGKPDARIIRARADYPKTEQFRMRESRTLTIDLNTCLLYTSDAADD